MKYHHPDSDFYRKVLGVEPPKAYPHVTEEEVLQNMVRLMPNNWVLKGNILEGETSQGKLVQRIPTDYILEKVENGLPVFKKVIL
ncbi:MAG: hypothetical protein KDH96_05875 [Candidatus Riesia sp.]|nr:hypothetical protein [Candidatus Riesia sp.]